MKALILENNVVQISENEFEVHETLQWVDANPNVNVGWKYIDGQFIAPQKPTQQQLIDACKLEAKAKIAKTDWAVLPDVGLVNQADFIAYRAALRELIINPVADPVWPTEPTPDWG